MKRSGTTLVYSPSDLVRYLESPFASWMDRRYLEDPAGLTPDPEDGQMMVLAKRGNEHEQRFLESLVSNGRDVVVLNRDQGTEAALAELAGGREIVFQARLSSGGFEGFADFLVRDDRNGGYSVWDTKLSRHVKPYHLVQLCCYAQMLDGMTGSRPAEVAVVLGDGRIETLRTNAYFYYYQRVAQRFLEMMERYPAGDMPLPEPSAQHGRWSSHAQEILEQRDHLSRVAGISRAQITRLDSVGIATMSSLAQSAVENVPGIQLDAYARLREQAALQVASLGLAQPLFRVLPPPADNPRLGLAALPPASSRDVFFDMEGFPASDGYLEYLFGAVTVSDRLPEFHDWWAHDSISEKKAFEDFMDWAYERWCQDPAMHVYHYAAYEPAAMKRLMGQYGSREHHVDTFLRNGVFVDLYEVVRRGVRIGEPRYSIKNVEHLYMERRGDVTDAGASIAFYDRWIESGESGDWRESPLLKAIRDYNEDDCVSTWKLAEWLRGRQSEAGLEYRGKAEPEAALEERVETDEARERREVVDSLLAEIPPEGSWGADDAPTWRIQALLAWLVEFHRREDKPGWWRHFDRLERTADELAEDLDCLGGLELTGPPEPVKSSQRFVYRFDRNQETKLATRSRVRFVPDIGLGAEIERFDPAGIVTLKVGNRKLTQLEGGTLPDRVSLIPGDFVIAKVIEQAIVEIAKQWRATRSVSPALMDFLTRARPRFRSADSHGPLARENEGTERAAVRLVGDLDSSCLCIQGPPGTGKTYTASRVIVELLKEGKRIGVTSNSHKAINNLMKSVCALTEGSVPVLKVAGDAEDELLGEFECIEHIVSNTDGAASYKSGLIGGTAWLFAQPDLKGRLDYLFVDEAGQVSLANLVAVSRATTNLVLMGDQMQLGQPIQGSHPGESGQSALEYYLQQHATIPSDLGIFLGVSHRLHPKICSFISDVIYEGRLDSAPGTAKRVIPLPKDADLLLQESGIVFVPVTHEGNSQASDEEVDAICRLTGSLLGRRIAGDPDPGRRVTMRDILYVAPYNLQVRRLIDRLPDGARVGSVDKFQGQEAPVVIVSLCASPGEFGPRGMEFVLDRNRLNVAISRAQSLAIVVGDPRLADTPASSPANMARLNLMARLVSIAG